MCRDGLAAAFADVLNASNPIELGEQVLPACAAFVFDHAFISTCKFACSTSRSTGTPQRRIAGLGNITDARRSPDSSTIPCSVSSYIGLLSARLGTAGLALQGGAAAASDVGTNAFTLASTLVTEVSTEIGNTLSLVDNVINRLLA